MKTKGILIFLGDQGIEQVIALERKAGFQNLVQSFSDSPAPGMGQKVHGRLRAPGVGCPGIGGAGIGIAQNFAGDQCINLISGLF